MLEVWVGTKGGELVIAKVEYIVANPWKLDVLEMLADLALEHLIAGDYGEAQRVVQAMSCLIAEIQTAFNEEE